MKTKTFLLSASFALLSMTGATYAADNTPENLNDLEIAHVAYTADIIDIRYAHLALALSNNPEIHEFANTMIRDHSTVNELALALLQKLEVSPENNFLSEALTEQSKKIVAEMQALDGDAFDRYYAKNELKYHKAVNNLVENSFLPNIENAEVKALFEQGLAIFKMHETHAENMVSSLNAVSMN
jgi:putative membrane protein